MDNMSALGFLQIFFAIIIGVYFLNLLQSQQGSKVAVAKNSRRENEKLAKMRKISLSEPLTAKIRPQKFSDIIGQEEGIKALKAALCGPNPQHVIIYGPPGVGKTTAARLVMDEAKKSPYSPFLADAKFIEVDGATSRFDERGIADPLIGSVHDPIYQGAGAMGPAGIPQPKPGAVSKAHGGILYIDEIGELHPMQINKLLKVLEDRLVMLESAYYNPDDANVPNYIKDIFDNGLPADFRLVGATTRQPEEIPAAIRSRCLEIYFRALLPPEVEKIAADAAENAGFPAEKEAVRLVGGYASNGRDAVNMIQIAAGLALVEARHEITRADIEWVINSGKYTPRLQKKPLAAPEIGVVNGLAVAQSRIGIVTEVEAQALKTAKGRGSLTITGIVEEEELKGQTQSLYRKSMAKSSAENVLTVLEKFYDVRPDEYEIHLNFPGGMPIDGPSAGVTMAVALYSAINNLPVDNYLAMTGEIAITGKVKPVGGVSDKIQAAIQMGLKRVIIPLDNYQSNFNNLPIEIIAVSHVQEVFDIAFIEAENENPKSCESLQRAAR
ncbi:MAG: ATP-dependent protease LonB [Clostridiales bacterium]|nr:MAG: ATP-dependent protease LonB [Clostridiales bacterium]